MSKMTCCGCWTFLVGNIKATSYRKRGRTVRRARYNEKEYSIEFENLIEEDDFGPSTRSVLSEAEKELLAQRRYNDLLDHQNQRAAAYDLELQKQEEDLRLEEEAYVRAKKEAAKVVRQTQSLQTVKPAPLKREFNSEEFAQWLTDEPGGAGSSSPELDVDDFDAFLEKVKARSLNGKTREDQNTEVLRKQHSWEASLSDGVIATKIADEALSALSTGEDDIDFEFEDEDDDELLLT